MIKRQKGKLKDKPSNNFWYFFIIVFLLVIIFVECWDYLFINLPPEKVHILAYHQIAVEANHTKAKYLFLYVHPDIFDEQMKYLKDSGISVITPYDLMKKHFFLNVQNKKFTILTFDDSTIGQYLNALPILKKYGYRGVFFVSSGTVGANTRHFNFDQMQEMSNAGMIIGAHGVFHRYEPNMNASELRNDIFYSKSALQKYLIPVDFFAYPYGAYNNLAMNFVDQAGYKMAFTINNSNTNFSKSPYSMGRIYVTNNLTEFKEIFND